MHWGTFPSTSSSKFFQVASESCSEARFKQVSNKIDEIEYECELNDTAGAAQSRLMPNADKLRRR